MATATDVETAIRKVLDRFAHTYAAKDSEGVLRLFAPGDDLQLVGTGADEIRLNRDGVRQQLERDFSQSDRVSISYQEPRVSTAANVAWAFVPCTVVASSREQNLVIVTAWRSCEHPAPVQEGDTLFSSLAVDRPPPGGPGAVQLLSPVRARGAASRTEVLD